MKRIVLIALAVVLYAVPVYQGRVAGEKALPGVLEPPAATAADEEEPLYFETFVNEPEPNTISHVSTISPDGRDGMASAWYSGSREGARDVAIYFSRFNREEMRWEKPSVLVDRKTCSRELRRYVKKVGNPVLFLGGGDRLWLFYSSVFQGGWSGASINYKFSEDGGVTWSESRKLILSPFFNLSNNVKNGALILEDGSFLLPVYHEFIGKFSQVLRFRPEEGGADYRICKIRGSDGAIQPALLPEGDGGLMALFRNASNGHALFSRSGDLGSTWSPLEDAPIPNPDSGLDAVALGDGGYLAAANGSFRDRSNLTLYISRDRGRSWRPIKTLEDSPGMEYSYPSLARERTGRYHITYTYERKRIKHVLFNDAWIREQEDGDD